MDVRAQGLSTWDLKRISESSRQSPFPAKPDSLYSDSIQNEDSDPESKGKLVFS